MHGLDPRSGSEAEGLREEADDESRIIHQRSSAHEGLDCTPCPLLGSLREGLPTPRLAALVMGAVMRIVFVCTGNICRSPFAEYLARELSGSTDIEFASAGIIARAGNPPSSDGVAVAAELGIDLTPHGASPLTSGVVATADIIYGMEDEHVEAVLELDPQARVELLRPDARGIPDPYGQDRQAYLVVYGLIEEALRRRLEGLDSERSSTAEKP
jgi:protein-tyrosine phosphatase